MRIPDCITWPLSRWALRYMRRHRIDQIIPDPETGSVLIHRYNLFDLPGFHVRLHELRGSDPRELHDHPWWNISIIILHAYNEVTPHGAVPRWTGDVVFRGKHARHRIMIDDGYYHRPLSLFIHGPKRRLWGFYTDAGEFRLARGQGEMQ
jgi:hypothetical protein